MDENEIHDVDEHLEPQERAPWATVPKEGLPWGLILLLIWAIALIIFSVQNAEQTTVEFLGWEWRMPIALLVMVTALATMVLSALIWSVYRRRRRKRLRKEAASPEDS